MVRSTGNLSSLINSAKTKHAEAGLCNVTSEKLYIHQRYV